MAVDVVVLGLWLVVVVVVGLLSLAGEGDTTGGVGRRWRGVEVVLCGSSVEEGGDDSGSGGTVGALDFAGRAWLLTGAAVHDCWDDGLRLRYGFAVGFFFLVVFVAVVDIMIGMEWNEWNGKGMHVPSTFLCRRRNKILDGCMSITLSFLARSMFMDYWLLCKYFLTAIPLASSSRS